MYANSVGVLLACSNWNPSPDGVLKQLFTTWRMVVNLEKIATDSSMLNKIGEGKTKEILEIRGHPDNVVIRSKDALTAFNAERRDELAGKAAIANKTTVNVFEYLQSLGIETHFVHALDDTSFIARNCAMIPIEWVARRIATGSFLKRNPGVNEGYRFNEIKLETFYKDDANNDPQWSDEQIICSEMRIGGLKIGKNEINLMKRMTKTIFRVLEKAWEQHVCTLVDMKIEFGVTTNGEIVLADVIDNDSWRLWPKNDRRLQLDKQAYRDMKEVTEEGLKEIIKNYAKVEQLTCEFKKKRSCMCRALIVMGSSSDIKFAQKIAQECSRFQIEPILRVCSAHKTTEESLELVEQFDEQPLVVLAVAGRSNGLGPVIAANSIVPVINCPPTSNDMIAYDIWSSVRMPSGIGSMTVLDPMEAALAAARIHASNDFHVFGTVLANQLNHQIKIYKSNKEAQSLEII